jgi:hypothetical protein
VPERCPSAVLRAASAAQRAKFFCPETDAGGHAKGAGSEIPLSVAAVNKTTQSALAAEDYFFSGQKSAIQKDNNRYF